MATWEDVAALVDALPLTGQPAPRHWRVGRKPLIWEHPLLPSEQHLPGSGAGRVAGRVAEATGASAAIAAVRVPDETAKQRLLAAAPAVYFATAYFTDYPVVLVRLDALPTAELGELLAEAWQAQAPRSVVREFLGRRT